MKLIDAYGHVSLPRFMSADEYLRAMDANDVECAVVTTAETCPDLGELSRAAVRHGDRLRVIGVPVGETPEEMLEGVAAQMEAGFSGIRLPERLIVEHPELLEPVGKAGGAVYAVSMDGLHLAAAMLTEFLDRYPDSVVCAPHFAGVAEAGHFDRSLHVRWLFRHSRFLVIFSRQGAVRRASLKPWAAALLEHVGPERVLWGSEYPVAVWRDETYRSTAEWIDSVGFELTEAQRAAFLGENARRCLFSRPAPAARPLSSRWCRMEVKAQAPVWVRPAGTLDLPEEVHRRLFVAYLAWGGDRRGTYSAFLSEALARVVEGPAARPQGADGEAHANGSRGRKAPVPAGAE